MNLANELEKKLKDIKDTIPNISAGGGGGESDFSTAEVTFLDADSNYEPFDWGNDIFEFPNLQNNGINMYVNPQSAGDKIIVPLYKNGAIITARFEDGDLEVIQDATGNVNITYVNPNNHSAGIHQIDIHGDCTLYLGYSQ